MMFECPERKTKYLEIDLIQTKRSENLVGTYFSQYCKRCLRRWPPKVVEVRPIEEK